ncbi:MRPL22 isoform 5, partial [Pongo abelii]
ELESELTACVDVAGALWIHNLRSRGKLAWGKSTTVEDK